MAETGKVRVAVVQAGAVPFDTAACVEKAVKLTAQAAAKGAKVIVFPEAFTFAPFAAACAVSFTAFSTQAAVSKGTAPACTTATRTFPVSAMGLPALDQIKVEECASEEDPLERRPNQEKARCSKRQRYRST